MSDDTISSSESDGLSLFDAVAMAAGAMIGAGIFAVLGEAAQTAGNAAFISFALAGILALITGVSYIRLTLRFDEPGGSFSYIEHIVGARLAGTLSWFLLLGYLFSISLYAYTFGAYAARLIGLNNVGGYLGAGVILALSLVNVAGVRESSAVENVLVYGKILVLVGVGILAFFVVEPGHPILAQGQSPTSIVSAAALIFVAYQGFQLLTYDYDDIDEPHHNLPRAMWTSIVLVILIYMLIAYVTTRAVSEQIIVMHTETVLAFVAEPVLGRAGHVLILVTAVFSTASAINSTIFATARLAKRVTHDYQIPLVLNRWERGGVPVLFVGLLAVFTIVVQFTGSLHEITSFSSLTFLVVFGAVNLIALAHHEYAGWKKLFPTIGFLGCIGAAGVLTYNLYAQGHVWSILLIVLGLLGLRLVYTYLHPDFTVERREELS